MCVGIRSEVILLLDRESELLFFFDQRFACQKFSQGYYSRTISCFDQISIVGTCDSLDPMILRIWLSHSKHSISMRAAVRVRGESRFLPLVLARAGVATRSRSAMMSIAPAVVIRTSTGRRMAIRRREYREKHRRDADWRRGATRVSERVLRLARVANECDVRCCAPSPMRDTSASGLLTTVGRRHHHHHHHHHHRRNPKVRLTSYALPLSPLSTFSPPSRHRDASIPDDDPTGTRITGEFFGRFLQRSTLEKRTFPFQNNTRRDNLSVVRDFVSTAIRSYREAQSVVRFIFDVIAVITYVMT